MRKLVHITTVPISLAFLRGQVGFMKGNGFDVAVISSPGEALDAFRDEQAVDAWAVEMPRQITPLRDLIALARLVQVLRRHAPTIVHAHTPKGGLLGMLAAALAGAPVRIYHMRGLPMMTARGWRRRLLRWTEKVACQSAHEVLCVSESLRELAIAEHLCAPAKIKVLAHGSGNGVDCTVRFNPANHADARAATRRRLGIAPDAIVIGFVGRLVRDKGLIELFDAWDVLAAEFANLQLLMIGPLEERDALPPHIVARLREPRVHWTGLDWNTPPLYAAMDVVALPTYREGFPNVPLEAAAMQLPTVATRIPGCVDAIQDGVTGTLVPVQDADALGAALRRYIVDPTLRRDHGIAGRAWVCERFGQTRLWEELRAEYLTLLGEAG